MILLKWLVASLATVRVATARPSHSCPATEPASLGGEDPPFRPTTSIEPMPPLGLTGALLAGLGAILLLHGGALISRGMTAEPGQQQMPSQWPTIARGLGGLAMMAGLALAGFVSRRADSWDEATPRGASVREPPTIAASGSAGQQPHSTLALSDSIPFHPLD